LLSISSSASEGAIGVEPPTSAAKITNTSAVNGQSADQPHEVVWDFNEPTTPSYSPLYTAFSAYFSRQLMTLVIAPGTGVRTEGA
jgi:hypothetical protein